MFVPNPALDGWKRPRPRQASEHMGTISELVVYPVKACRGVSVTSARVTKTGFELDRAFCVVDTIGNVVWKASWEKLPPPVGQQPARACAYSRASTFTNRKGEAISQRALPVLATIGVALSASGDELTLSAPGKPQVVRKALHPVPRHCLSPPSGMRDLKVPTAIEAYEKAPEIEIFASGNTTPSLGASAPGGWNFGSIMCRCYEPASAWLTEYLNRTVDPAQPGVYVSGKSKTSTFALVRSVTSGLEMSSFKRESAPLAAQAFAPATPLRTATLLRVLHCVRSRGPGSGEGEERPRVRAALRGKFEALLGLQPVSPFQHSVVRRHRTPRLRGRLRHSGACKHHRRRRRCGLAARSTHSPPRALCLGCPEPSHATDGRQMARGRRRHGPRSSSARRARPPAPTAASSSCTRSRSALAAPCRAMAPKEPLRPYRPQASPGYWPRAALVMKGGLGAV